MKRLAAIFLIGILPILSAAEITLAENGQAKAGIVIPEKAKPIVQMAARELAAHLKQMTGADFAIVTASEYKGGPRLAIGFQKGLPEVLSSERFPNLSPEELVIDSSGDTILLAGGRPRGALYATYEFLESLGMSTE